MVQGVAGGVQTDEFATCQIDVVAFMRDIHALGGNRHDAAVAARHFFFAINGGGAGDEPGRVDHVAGATRVYDDARVR